MAERTEIETLGQTKRGRPFRYPWDQWFDGAVWELQQGVDYTGTRDQMRSVAMAAAKARGGKVVTRSVPDHRDRLRIQFHPGAAS